MSKGEETRYKVTFLGPVQNDLPTMSKLAEGLKDRFKLDDEAVTRMMKMVPVVIKKGANVSEAQKYKQIIEAIGGKVQVDPIETVPVPDKPQTAESPPPPVETGAEQETKEQGPQPLDREPQVIPVQAKTPPPEAQETAPPKETKGAEPQMLQCPQCGYVQEQTDECIKCGVIISKILKYQAEDKPAEVERVASSVAETPAAEIRSSKIIRNPIFLFILILVFLAPLSIWSYYSPHRTLNKIQVAAEKGDTEALRNLIDFSAVRESIKEQIKSIIAKEMAAELEDNPFAAFGMMLANSMIDMMVDSFLTPSSIASIVKGEKTKFDPSKNPNENINSTEERNMEYKISKKYRYEGLSKFIASFCNKDQNTECISLILRRVGLKWKLTEIQLPEMY